MSNLMPFFLKLYPLVKKSAERSGLKLGEEKIQLREKLVQLQKKKEKSYIIISRD
jgi:hypothetical protein